LSFNIELKEEISQNFIDSDLQEFTVIYRNLQEFTGVYRSLQEFTGIYRNLQEYTGNIITNMAPVR